MGRSAARETPRHIERSACSRRPTPIFSARHDSWSPRLTRGPVDLLSAVLKFCATLALARTRNVPQARRHRALNAGPHRRRRCGGVGPRFAYARGVRLAEYTPRDPGASVLYAVVRDHFETFRAESSRLRDGDGLPRLIEDEFGAFLRCGWLAGGFARFQCDACKANRLVAFSCCLQADTMTSWVPRAVR